MTYDPNNIFARILRNEIPCKKIYEDESVFAFQDIAPKAAIHVLVIPKGSYKDFPDFCYQASAAAIGDFFKRVDTIAKELGLLEHGYRLIINYGIHGGQEVPHFHIHILGGNPIGPMTCDS